FPRFDGGRFGAIGPDRQNAAPGFPKPPGLLQHATTVDRVAVPLHNDCTSICPSTGQSDGWPPTGQPFALWVNPSSTPSPARPAAAGAATAGQPAGRWPQRLRVARQCPTTTGPTRARETGQAARPSRAGQRAGETQGTSVVAR